MSLSSIHYVTPRCDDDTIVFDYRYARKYFGAYYYYGVARNEVLAGFEDRTLRGVYVKC